MGRRKSFIYGDDLGLLAQLEITYTTRNAAFVKSDETWQSLPSRLRAASFMMERYMIAKRIARPPDLVGSYRSPTR